MGDLREGSYLSRVIWSHPYSESESTAIRREQRGRLVLGDASGKDFPDTDQPTCQRKVRICFDNSLEHGKRGIHSVGAISPEGVELRAFYRCAEFIFGRVKVVEHDSRRGCLVSEPIDRTCGHG